MISYGINHEDVLLRRLFPEPATGFYVDVGAGDPVAGSLTKHFYDRGWSGVNVEASATLFARLQAQRPRDANVHAALSAAAGEATFYEAPVEQYGVSTLVADVAARHRSAGIRLAERPVTVTTLADVLGRHGRDAIDFLTVDVEGHEREVLAGNDWSRWRPRVLVIEAVTPDVGGHGESQPSHEPWEPAVLAAGYRFAAFDGLNRYYVRVEDAVLAQRLAVPVNVFDRFTPYAHVQQVQQLREQAAGAEALRRAAAEQLRELWSMRPEPASVPARLARLERALANAALELAALEGRPPAAAERGQASFAEAQARAEAAEAAATQARAEAETARAEAELLRSRVAAAARELAAMGPLGSDLARWLTRASQRHRGAARLAKLPFRALARLTGRKRPYL